MIYFLDTADLDVIRHCNAFYPISGVTTNPAIIARTGADFFPHLKEIRAIIGDEKILHVQTRATDAEGIVKEAFLLQKHLGGDFRIKIPIGEEGLRATMMLRNSGIRVTMTAIFSPTQALTAAMAGASFVAPFVNRLDNIIGDGVGVVAEIVRLFACQNITDCKVLAASFKNAEQVYKCALAGCPSITVTDDILKTMVSHPLTDAALATFDREWNAVYGERKISDLI